jgi:hypothetical protein
VTRRGATLIEGCVCLVLLATTLTLLFQITRASVANLWLDHVLYQTLICLAEQRPETDCRRQAYNQAKLLPLAVERLNLRLSQHSGKWQGSFEWLGPLGITGRRAQTLDLVRRAREDLRSSRCCF